MKKGSFRKMCDNYIILYMYTLHALFKIDYIIDCL